MSDFSETWELVRKRFDDAVAPMDKAQLNWQMHGHALTIGQMALHVAGVEVSFVTQLTGATPDALGARLKAAATDGVVNENPFPFAADEITPELVAKSLAMARGLVESVMPNPTAQILATQIKSALGPMIDGAGAFARLAYHPGYHHGQVQLVQTAPGFPGF